MTRAIAKRRVAGEVLEDVGTLAHQAPLVARRAAAPSTRANYATTYRALGRFMAGGLGREPLIEDLDADAVIDFRDALEAAGRSPTTIAKDLSAIRFLARELGADDAIQSVRADRGDAPLPRPISEAQYALLLAQPNRRTLVGKRDVAILRVLGSCGLRRREVCALRVTDVEERDRAPDPALRAAVAGARANETRWWLTVRHSKRGRSRQVPIDRDTLEALKAWARERQAIAAASDHLFVTLARNGDPAPLTVRAVHKLVERHARAAGLPEDRRSPHVLRHTFVTLVTRRSGIAVAQKLAGHADPRTTARYAEVDGEDLEQAIATTFERTPLDRLVGAA
jgi:integrase/recombinase XerD